MAKSIPDGWLKYKAIGERIEGTRFIAFKVPLSYLDKSVDEIERFEPAILLKKLTNLGVIIDLTNTHRYYQPNEFILEGVEHVKLMIPGHATPPKYLVEKFKSYVTNFLKCNKDNDKLIGVHCTHGVNRTGYLICNYMISEMAIKPKDAIERFGIARGHKIERQNYLESLQHISGSNNDAHTKSNRKSFDSKEVTIAQQLTKYKSWREHREPAAVDHFTDRRDRYERCSQDMLQNRSNCNRFNSAVNKNQTNYNRFNIPPFNRNNNPRSNYLNERSKNYSTVTQQRSVKINRYDSRGFNEAASTKKGHNKSTSNNNSDSYHYVNNNTNNNSDIFIAKWTTSEK